MRLLLLFFFITTGCSMFQSTTSSPLYGRIKPTANKQDLGIYQMKYDRNSMCCITPRVLSQTRQEIQECISLLEEKCNIPASDSKKAITGMTVVYCNQFVLDRNGDPSTVCVLPSGSGQVCYNGYQAGEKIFTGWRGDSSDNIICHEMLHKILEKTIGDGDSKHTNKCWLSI